MTSQQKHQDILAGKLEDATQVIKAAINKALATLKIGNIEAFTAIDNMVEVYQTMERIALVMSKFHTDAKIRKKAENVVKSIAKWSSRVYTKKFYSFLTSVTFEDGTDEKARKALIDIFEMNGAKGNPEMFAVVSQLWETSIDSSMEATELFCQMNLVPIRGIPTIVTGVNAWDMLQKALPHERLAVILTAREGNWANNVNFIKIARTIWAQQADAAGRTLAEDVLLESAFNTIDQLRGLVDTLFALSSQRFLQVVGKRINEANLFEHVTRTEQNQAETDVTLTELLKKWVEWLNQQGVNAVLDIEGANLITVTINGDKHIVFDYNHAQHPACYNVGNGYAWIVGRPMEGKLTEKEAKMVLHEGGHAAHLLIPNFKYYALRSLKAESVEVPSVVMELLAVEFFGFGVERSSYQVAWFARQAYLAKVIHALLENDMSEEPKSIIEVMREVRNLSIFNDGLSGASIPHALFSGNYTIYLIGSLLQQMLTPAQLIALLKDGVDLNEFVVQQLTGNIEAIVNGYLDTITPAA